MDRDRENHMKKKITVLTLCAILFALCLRAEAQQPTKIPRIGYLGASSPTTNTARIEAFRRGLRELGYVAEKNMVIEWRYAEGKPDGLPTLAAELGRLKVEIIATSAQSSIRAGKAAPVT